MSQLSDFDGLSVRWRLTSWFKSAQVKGITPTNCFPKISPFIFLRFPVMSWINKIMSTVQTIKIELGLNSRCDFTLWMCNFPGHKSKSTLEKQRKNNPHYSTCGFAFTEKNFNWSDCPAAM